MKKLLILLFVPFVAQAQPIPGTVYSKQSGAWTNACTQSGTWNVTNISGTVSLPTGASTAAKQPALGTAGTASNDVLTVQGIAAMTPLLVNGSASTQPVSGTVTCNAGTGTLSTNIAQMNGVAVTMGNGVAGTGVQRVAIASDNTAFTTNSAQSGTWTVQPGNTANTTPWLTSLVPATSGGWTPFHLVSAASTNATNVKASAGQLGGWFIYNNNAAMRKVCFHNTAGTPTAGAGVIFCINLPNGPSAANAFTDAGIPFNTGIAITTVTDLTDPGATAVGLNDLSINLFYK